MILAEVVTFASSDLINPSARDRAAWLHKRMTGLRALNPKGINALPTARNIKVALELKVRPRYL